MLLKIEWCKVKPSLVRVDPGLVAVELFFALKRVAISSISLAQVFSSNEMPIKSWQ